MRRVVVCVAALCLSCGRSTLEPGWSWEDSGGRGGAMGQAAGGGGQSSFGGSGFAGTGFGGFVMTAGTTTGGSLPMGGLGAAGEPSSCALPAGDCRGAEPGCADRFECSGAVGQFDDYRSTRAAITDISTSPEGTVVIAGYYEDQLDLGGDTDALGLTDGTDPFVAGFTADDIGRARWLATVAAAGTQTVSGIDLRPDDQLVLQGSWDELPGADPRSPAGAAFFTGVGSEHQVGQIAPFGLLDEVRPGGVAVDNNGIAYLAGTFTNHLQWGSFELSAGAESGYLAKVDGTGAAEWLIEIRPHNWLKTRVTRVVADDEDNVVVIGEGGDDSRDGFFQKRSPSGELLLSREFSASESFSLRAVAVDRQMRITVGGSFAGAWRSDDIALDSSNQIVGDAWVAQFNAMGSALWASTYASEGKGVGARVTALTIDPYGNAVAAGVASYIDVDGEILEAALSNFDHGAFVVKLRSDGSKVWARPFYGAAEPELALAADANANIWLGGSFTGPLRVDDVTMNPLGTDAFLIRLGP